MKVIKADWTRNIFVVEENTWLRRLLGLKPYERSYWLTPEGNVFYTDTLCLEPVEAFKKRRVLDVINQMLDMRNGDVA